jgi:Asp-tRNA(Asn)/Glu-tRNA(Gln) amidotransferase C subunit
VSLEENRFKDIELLKNEAKALDELSKRLISEAEMEELLKALNHFLRYLDRLKEELGNR